MSRASSRHGPGDSERLVRYALQVLADDEMRAVEAHIAGCARCRRKFVELRPVVDPSVARPTELLRPSALLWSRLAQRVAGKTRAKRPLPPPQWAEPEWAEVAPGISCKLLATDTERSRVSMLVRLAPETDYPPHRHAGVEELHLLEGELMIDDRKLYPGDYNRAEPGSIDSRVWSETGCTCLLMACTRDEIRTSGAAKPDDARIDISQGYEIDYWCRVLRCTERQLRDAVEKVGPRIEDIRRRLRRR